VSGSVVREDLDQGRGLTTLSTLQGHAKGTLPDDAQGEHIEIKAASQCQPEDVAERKPVWSRSGGNKVLLLCREWSARRIQYPIGQ